MVELQSETLSATVNPLGAELWSLRDADGRELMTDADPAFWTGHAPLLFPFVGRLREDRYRVNGAQYTLPQHGFARKRAFALVESDDTSAIFRLEADEATRENYPFDFRLDMTFALTGATLAMTATVSNRGSSDMPFSVGYHPALPGRCPMARRLRIIGLYSKSPNPRPSAKSAASLD